MAQATTNHSTGEQAKDAAQQAGEKLQESTHQAMEQAREKTRGAAAQAQDRVRDQVDQRSTDVGKQVNSTAGDVRTIGDQLRQQGKDKPAQLADQVAERAERLGGYLEQADADQLLRDFENFGRRQPWAVAAGGLAIGFLASRFIKASSQRRYTASTPNGFHYQTTGARGVYSEGMSQGSNPDTMNPERAGAPAFSTDDADYVDAAPTGAISTSEEQIGAGRR